MFDYANQMKRLIADVCNKVPVFSHIKPHQIIISYADAKHHGAEGTWAQLYPMKYENGYYSTRERVGNKIYLYKTKRLKSGRSEILYIIYFMMPRFQNFSYFRKLETIFHELFHMSPKFDGRLRKLHPRYIFHGPSMRLYDERIRYWVRYYLKKKPNLNRNRFLNYNAKQLHDHYGKIDYVYIPEPKEVIRVLAPGKRRRKPTHTWGKKKKK